MLQVRTFGAGIGVLAICLLLASLSWQFVLCGFALASIVWACWSASNQLRPRKREQALPPPAAFDPSRRRRTRGDNVYAFPGQDWNSQSMLN